MKLTTWTLGLLTGLLAVGCSASSSNEKSSVASGDRPTSASVSDDEDDDDGDEDEQDLALSEVPASIQQAALASGTEPLSGDTAGVTVGRTEGDMMNYVDIDPVKDANMFAKQQKSYWLKQEIQKPRSH